MLVRIIEHKKNTLMFFRSVKVKLRLALPRSVRKVIMIGPTGLELPAGSRNRKILYFKILSLRHPDPIILLKLNIICV